MGNKAEFIIKFTPKSIIKEQTLVDFIVDNLKKWNNTSVPEQLRDEEKMWELHWWVIRILIQSRISQRWIKSQIIPNLTNSRALEICNRPHGQNNRQRSRIRSPDQRPSTRKSVGHNFTCSKMWFLISSQRGQGRISDNMGKDEEVPEYHARVDQ